MPWNPLVLIFFRPSARFPQHRRKKRKEMDEGIPESSQHKQSKLSVLIKYNYNYIAVVIAQLLCDHYWLVLNCTIPCNFLYIVFPHSIDSYIIKLFDRSVDLAQFNTSTPLYPICRAWMRNNPSVRETAAFPSPSHSMVEEEVRSYMLDNLNSVSNKT